MCCSWTGLECKRDSENGLAGYMTVEAALILSTVFMVYLFLIHSFLWVYDRCVLEQDMAALALRCAVAEENKLEIVWQQEMNSWDREKYLWLEPEEPVLEKQGWKFTITGRGEDTRLGTCGVSYEVWRFIPEDWLRMKRKLEQEGNTEREGSTE